MSPRTEAGKRYGFYVDPDEDHPRRSGDAYNTVWHAIDAIEAEARAQALDEVRAGVEGLPLAKALSDMNYRAVLALLDRLSKGTDG